MNNMSDEHIDQHFKTAAEGAYFPFDESAWANLEQKMTGSRFSYYQVIGTVLIALILMVGTSIYLLNPLPQTEMANIESEEAKNNAVAQIETTNAIEKIPKPEEAISISSRSVSPTNDETSFDAWMVEEIRTQNKSVNNQQGEDVKAIKTLFVPTRQQDQSKELLTRLGSDLELNPYNQLIRIEFSSVKVEKTQDIPHKTKSPWAVKLQYSPDVSSVGYFDGGKVGSNWGVGLEYKIFNKWSISTGLILSRKLYYTEEQLTSYSYYGYGNSDIQRLEANCQVLDIPINISYKVLSRERSGFHISTGLSSYIMLSEDYLYKTNGNDWEQNYTNENSHIFSIVNLSLGYEHFIGRNTALQLEPFIKAPISGIGEGKVDLVSSGLFINLKYQFNKRKK